MILKTSLLTLAAFAMALPLSGQSANKPTPVKFRAVLHDPVNPVADLYFTDETGAIVPLNFRPKALTESLATLPVNGSLVLFDKENVDPENPAESVAASVKLPPSLKELILVVMPGPPDEDPAYRLMVIEDSEKAFPGGESRVITLINREIGIQAGEHRLPARPGKITRIPPVRKVNDFNMAQTNFYFRDGDSLTAFTERQLQFIDECRRIFIVYATPGAMSPAVSTIKDVSR